MDELHSQRLTIGIPLFVTAVSIVAICTVVLNAIFLVATVKKRLLNTPSNFLLGILCCNDLLTGLIALPLYVIGVSQRRTWLILKGDVLLWGSVFSYIFQGFSFLILTLVSLDRYAAICHPYKYIHHATFRLYTQIVLCSAIVYLTTTVAASVIIVEKPGLFRYIFGNITSVLFTAITIFCSWKIYKVIQYKLRCVTGITVQDVANARGSQRERKRAYVILLLISVHFICYLPFYITFHLIYNNPSMFSTMVDLTFVKRWSYFPFFLNGVFNPLIYYFRMAYCRAAVRDVMGCS